MTYRTPRAFFSYSREDSDFAMRLAADLRASGSAVWLDQLDIHPGERWDRSVENALAECKRMLVILSPSSVNSTNVMDEVSFALEEKKTVIPVLYRDCKIPFRLRRVQHIDCRLDYDRALRELLTILLDNRLRATRVPTEIHPDARVEVERREREKEAIRKAGPEQQRAAEEALKNSELEQQQPAAEEARKLPPELPPPVPGKLKQLLEELRMAATGPSFPKAEWYWTRTPDYRVRVVSGGDSRVFFRVFWAKEWFRVELKDVENFKVANSADLEKHRDDIQTAYNKADTYLQRGK